MAKDPPETTPLLDFDDKISDLQCQIDILKGKPRSNEGEMCKTMVVGGLQAFESLQVATKWLRDKLETLKVPTPSETYMKAQSFNGVLFAKFSSSYDRDIAIATLRSANIKHDQHHIWATQDSREGPLQSEFDFGVPTSSSSCVSSPSISCKGDITLLFCTGLSGVIPAIVAWTNLLWTKMVWANLSYKHVILQTFSPRITGPIFFYITWPRSINGRSKLLTKNYKWTMRQRHCGSGDRGVVESFRMRWRTSGSTNEYV